MAHYSNYFIVEIFGIIITIIISLYVYLKYVAFNYWSSRKIDFVEPSIPFGNFSIILSGKSSVGEFFRDTYMEFKRKKVCGIYSVHKPTLIVNDPDLIRIVLTKNFSHFHDRGMYCNEKVDPLSGHLFSLPGAKWRFLRTKFSPTFTSSKIKQMFFTVKDCSETLAAYVADKAKGSELIGIKDLLARFSTDVIASAAFGIQCNSIENPQAEFRECGRKFFVAKPITNALAQLFPSVLKLFRIPVIDVDISNFFINVFKETMDYRIANNVVRNDFMNLIIQLMDKGFVQPDEGVETEKTSDDDDTRRITLHEGAAQAFVFWLAGWETSSTTGTHCLYELALHQELQDKVADEIISVLKEFGGVTYDNVKKMHYLDKVVSETLRKYPPLPMLHRECTEEFDLPGTGLRVAKGIQVVIPVLGLHSDPDIYPDPEKFDPERFTEENIASRHQYSYLPFGEGPRNCIGMRFGLVQTKVGLINLLSKYRFKPGPDLKVPIKVDKRNFLLCPEGEITLRIEER